MKKLLRSMKDGHTQKGGQIVVGRNFSRGETSAHRTASSKEKTIGKTWPVSTYDPH